MLVLNIRPSPSIYKYLILETLVTAHRSTLCACSEYPSLDCQNSLAQWAQINPFWRRPSDFLSENPGLSWERFLGPVFYLLFPAPLSISFLRSYTSLPDSMSQIAGLMLQSWPKLLGRSALPPAPRVQCWDIELLVWWSDPTLCGGKGAALYLPPTWLVVSENDQLNL